MSNTLPTYTAEQLIAFEDQVASLFNGGKIRAPVHLYSGNEAQMIEAFAPVRPNDWIFCSWRSHYQCLLKGVSEQQLLDEIVAGHSISLCFPEQRIYRRPSSAACCRSRSAPRWRSPAAAKTPMCTASWAR